MSRLRYIAFRSVQTVVLLFVILTFLFFFFRLLPGSYVGNMLYEGASVETVEAFEEEWGLNEPLYVQYYRYLANLMTGDAGTSMIYRTPVIEFIRTRIFNSFILIAPAILLGYLIGSIFGGYIGNKRGSRIEKYGLSALLFVGSFPVFFTGIVMIIVFAGWLGLVPTSGMMSTGNPYTGSEYPWWRPYLTFDFAHHYIMPFSAIVLRYIYVPTLIMRTSVVEVRKEDFFFYHRMTGLPGTRRLRHLTRHASLPVITYLPISLTSAIGGLVVLEVVFNWPGIGYALVSAVFSRDYPVVQFVFFVIAAFIIIANFVVDLVYGIIDPRVTVGDGD